VIDVLTGEAVFIFRDLARNVLSSARYAQYKEWVENAERARQDRSMSRRDGNMNQYDKAEELITWNTFAPLLKVAPRIKDTLIADIVNLGLQKDATEYLDDWGFNVQFEKTLPPPPSYLNHLRSTVTNHPVRYVRLDAEGKETLEGDTHADIAFENSRLLVLGEVKFMSDIQWGVTYDPNRNQLARLIDTGIRAARDKKLAVILFSPESVYHSKSRLYYYKLKDYRESIGNLRADISHRSLEEITKTLIGTGWVPLEFAASAIHRKAVERGLLVKEDSHKFYEERRIDISI
jgi:hypothetical protein